MVDRSATLGPEGRVGAREEHAGVSAEELPELLREVRHFHARLVASIAALEEGERERLDAAVKEAHSIKSLVAFARLDGLTRLCHLLEEALPELVRREGQSRSELLGLTIAAGDALACAFDAMEHAGRAVPTQGIEELAARLDERVRGVRIGDPGEQYRIEIPEPLGRALTGPGRAALLAAMGEGLPILHVMRRLDADQPLTHQWAAQAPPGMVVARALGCAEREGLEVHYLVVPCSADPYLATTARAARSVRLRYARRLKPGADPSQIRLRIEPADEAALRRAAASGEEIWIVSIDHGIDDPIREGRSRHVFEALRELGAVHLAAPPLEELEAGESHGAFRLVMGLGEGAGPVRELLEQIAGDADWAVRPFVFTSADLDAPAGDVAPGAVGERSSVLVDRRTLEQIIGHAEALMAARDPEPCEGCCGGCSSQNSSNIEDPLHSSIEGLRGALDDLLNVPAERLLEGVERLARDVSRRRGRSVRVVTDLGCGLRLPRRIADALRDPILHLVRNAVDHGIEALSDRVEAGKAPVGTLRISIGGEGGRWWLLEVADDGRGIDESALRARAGEHADLPLEQLVFAPGVSRRESADEISGRGVGLGIVQDAVRRIGGRITLDNRPGTGTVFRVEVPNRSEEKG